jgi:hypothetical protein
MAGVFDIELHDEDIVADSDEEDQENVFDAVRPLRSCESA